MKTLNIGLVGYGFMGRTPDYKASFMATLGANPEFYAPYEQNARDWYRRYATKAMYLNHVLINPPVDRSRPVHEVADVFLHVVRETDAGAIVSGAKMLATGSALPPVPPPAAPSPTPTEPEFGPLPAQAPSSFDPLVQYATFGWLPAGSTGLSVTTARDWLAISAEYVGGPTSDGGDPSPGSISLIVVTAGHGVDPHRFGGHAVDIAAMSPGAAGRIEGSLMPVNVTKQSAPATSRGAEVGLRCGRFSGGRPPGAAASGTG